MASGDQTQAIRFVGKMIYSRSLSNTPFNVNKLKFIKVNADLGKMVKRIKSSLQRECFSFSIRKHIAQPKCESNI